MGNYRERIAAVQHEIWSHWMRYLFSVCTLDSFGNVFIPVEKVQRWQRQMNTDYADLSGAERESDRHQADKVLAERDAEIAQLKAQVAELQALGNVPLDALRRYYHGTTKVSALIDSVYSEGEYLKDSDMIERWFKDMD